MKVLLRAPAGVAGGGRLPQSGQPSTSRGALPLPPSGGSPVLFALFKGQPDGIPKPQHPDKPEFSSFKHQTE